MTIKSSQTLVSEALKEIKTISTDEAHEMSSNDQCNLIDIRDIRELEKEGRINLFTKYQLKVPKGNGKLDSIDIQHENKEIKNGGFVPPFVFLFAFKTIQVRSALTHRV